MNSWLELAEPNQLDSNSSFAENWLFLTLVLFFDFDYPSTLKP